MKKFQDSQGGAWEIDLTIGNVFRVKDASEGRFDLFEPTKPVDGVPLGQLLDESDSVFWELLCHLVEPQLLLKDSTTKTVPIMKDGEQIGTEKRGDFNAFGILLAADCWHVARRKFFEEWVDFFQSLQRPDKALPLEKLAKYQAKALELVKAKLTDQRLQDLDPKVYAKMASALNRSFSGSLDLLESTLNDTPGES
jgi:hypothetical protein